MLYRAKHGLYWDVNRIAKLSNYLAEGIGLDSTSYVEAERQVSSLPLYLRTYYRFVQIRLFGQPVVFAVQADDRDNMTPAEYRRHYEVFREHLDAQTAIVIGEVPSYTRRQLIKMGVPFVVPGRQMFLPALLTDLREHFPVQKERPRHVTAAAQVILLRHLVGGQIEGIALRQLANELGYSAMMVTKACKELQAAELCRTVVRRRETHIQFELKRRPLWEKAFAYLRSPVRGKHWVKTPITVKDCWRAGISALATVSLLSDDSLPTYAMKHEIYRRKLEQGVIHGCGGPEEATARVECWRYDPGVLVTDGIVDYLSLYLSLCDEQDERVVEARDSLLERLSW